ncbi:MAG: hypothetical protein M3068_11740 [Gemmatimonadota bacterium]|nr:hypothetical protein [Gemmatimonadota bacterium]
MSDQGERVCVLALNGGSSSIRFAVYESGAPHERKLAGKIDRIGSAHATLIVSTAAGGDPSSRELPSGDDRAANGSALDWLEAQPIFASVRAAGRLPRELELIRAVAGCNVRNVVMA